MPVQYFTAVQTIEVAESGATAAVTGSVLFTPNFSEADSLLYDCAILIPPVPAVFNASGELCTPSMSVGVPLVDSFDLGLGDTPLLYQVEYSDMTDGLLVNSFWFAAPGTGLQVDLNTVIRVPPSGGIIPGPITY